MALSNIQYDEIMRHYGRIQVKNRELLEMRKERVYKTIPEIVEFENEMRKISVERAKALLRKEDNSAEKYRNKMRELSEEREALLIGAGYDVDYLDEIYDCKACRDTGYVEGEKCGCMRKMEIDLLYKQSYMDEVLDKENFEKFDWDCFNDNYRIKEEGNISLKEYMMKIVENVIKNNYLKKFDDKNSSNSIIFIGPSGVGKTFLIHCIAKELIDSGHSVVYLTADRLFEMLTGRRVNDDNQEYDNKYQLAYDCDLLVIDDLGTEYNNSLTNSEFFNCINDRLLRNKAVIISSNLNTEDIRKIYSERVASRIFTNYKYIPLYGEDLRIRRKNRS